MSTGRTYVYGLVIFVLCKYTNAQHKEHKTQTYVQCRTLIRPVLSICTLGNLFTNHDSSVNFLSFMRSLQSNEFYRYLIREGIYRF